MVGLGSLKAKKAISSLKAIAFQTIASTIAPRRQAGLLPIAEEEMLDISEEEGNI